jgi:ribonuclease T1
LSYRVYPNLLREILVRKSRFKLVLTGFLLAVSLVAAGANAKSAFDQSDVSIAFSALPQQGQETHRRIYQGGPFPYEKDGVVFGNRERFLPIHTRGYYREYTVRTPGSRGRGARRIVCGGPATKPDACFYTADHYASFRRIVP